MLFNSYVFLYAFLPLCLAGFYATARFGRRPAAVWLVLASLAFYGWWNPAFVPILAVSVAFNYAAGALIGGTIERPRLQTWLLRLAVAADLAALVHYKYVAWLASLLRGFDIVDLRLDDVVLPLGISFFTFTQIGYLLDVKHGLVRDRSALNYAVFVTFFPHLIAGPILHNGEMLPQFANPATYRFDARNFGVGFGIFTVGLLKKCVLADPIGAAVPMAFAQPDALTLLSAWHAALAYSLQLYFDFSGYSDMAIGLALLFNVRFPLNFNSPYRAESVIDYWQRWHMTLTRYFTQYVYNPLALAAMRRRRARGLRVDRTAQLTARGFLALVALPIWVTIVLAGIWHGAGATFLVFGALHATYLTVARAWRIARPNAPAPSRGGRLWRLALTYGCVLVASVFFRAPSVPAALSLLAGMVGLHGVGTLALPQELAAAGSLPGWLLAHDIVELAPWRAAVAAWLTVPWLVGLYAIVWLAPNTQQIFANARPVLDEVTPASFGWPCWRPGLPWAVVCGGAAALGLLAMGGTGEFLYFQF